MPDETHRWVVDSIADDIATIEVDGRQTVRLPRWMLPRGAREGDVLSVRHEVDAAGARSTLAIDIDRDATAEALRASNAQVAAIRQASRRRDPGGDVAL